MTPSGLGDLAGVRAILIGGTSHAGKSTLARQIAADLGWAWVSTDSLGRHPGRPWPTEPGREVPPHVATHYSTLTVPELIADVLRHYRRLAPSIRLLVRGAHGLVLEGSALLPATVAPLLAPDVRATWLTATPAEITSRIRASSNYALRDERQRALIESFTARAIAFAELIEAEAAERGLPFA